MSNKTSLVFKVSRQKPELITPAAPTRYEFKELSDIDDQPGLWIRVPGIQFYRSAPNMLGADPARVTKEAISKALVPFYPLAGRLRKKEGNKLVVECTAEGVMFTEADAEVRLDEFSEAQLHPPIPCIDELLYDELDGYDGILNSPLLLIQVTRLKCGGFILTHKINHVMADGTSLAQFLNAVGELARGATFLSVYPIWKRDLIRARDPPQVTCEHPEYDQIPVPFGDDLVHKAFFFGATEIAALRCSLPAHQKSSSTFEILTAVIWRSRTIALRIRPDEEVRLKLYMNTRSKYKNLPLPSGFYGKGIATPVTISTAGLLTRNPIGYAIDQVKLLKNKVNEEYVKSLVDFLVVNGKPQTTRAHTFTVSDLSKLKLDRFDFGWGPPVQGGPARGYMGGPTPGYGSFYLASKNSKGESGILVPIYLPTLAMDRFENEINGYLNESFSEHPICSPRSYEKNGVTLGYGVGVKA